ncbi:MAG: hypothetical protein NTZ01_00335 [Verrucomicrobia bacterium]|nr:hypothetical protein [Verrucomicrobiota bacterium]
MSSSTLTIRLPQHQREVLRRTAKALRKSESEYIRTLLARDMDSIPFAQRLGDLVGCLDSSATTPPHPHPLKEQIRANNWRR